MARGQRNAEFTGDTNTETEATTESTSVADTATGEQATPEAKDTDRGNIGIVTVERDTEEWGSVRTRTSNNPVAVAVRDAVKGEPYGIVVENDEKKIERVKRMLRAAAQREDVGMNIHPVHSPVAGSEDENGNPTKVKVRFKTGERDKRAAKPTTDTPTDGTEGTDGQTTE